MRAWLSKNRYRLLFGIGFAVLFFLLQIDAVHRFSASFIEQELTRQNLAYLSHVERESRGNLIKLAEIFAVLKVIESGQVGISFIIDAQVRVGRALAAFSDLVERGIVVSVVAASAAVGLKGLVRLADVVSPILFKLALPLLATYFIAASISSAHLVTIVSRVLSEAIVALFLTAYLLIPYSIHGTGWLSQQITADLKQEGREHLNHIHQELTQGKQRKARLKERAEHAIHEFERTAVHVPQKVSAMSLFLIRHVAATIIEGVLFPIGIFLALWFTVRQVIRRIGELVQGIKSEELEQKGGVPAAGR